jgi:hypothetical protein
VTRRLARAACLAAALLASAPAREAGARVDEATSAHVAAEGDVGAELLKELVDLGEAGWPHWKAYFEKEPPASRMPLRMDVRRTREKFIASLRSAGVTGDLPGAGGYYDPKTRISFLYLQPHVSSTRLLVLHELTHQFQYKALQDDVPDRSPPWHREGLAEHFGAHRRASTGLEVGALDVVAIDERPCQCAERVAAGTFKPWEVATGAKEGDYTDALALVETLLRTKDVTLTKLFHKWEDEIYKGGNANKRFERVFTGMKDRLAAASTEVWGGFRRTWRVGYVAWDEKDGTVVGTGTPWAFLEGQAPLAAGHASVRADVSLAADALAGGLALASRGKEDFLGVEVRKPDVVSLRRRRDRAWTEIAKATLPAAISERPVRLRISLVGSTATVEAGGTQMLRQDVSAALSPAELSGAAGLFAEGGPVRFGNLGTGD